MAFFSLRSSCCLLMLAALPLAGQAASDGAVPAAAPTHWDAWAAALEQTWHAGQYELYLPLNIWHNRARYSAQKIASYNENPWGLGIGRYRYDANGDRHNWYAMAFLESHDTVEPVLGYAFQKVSEPRGGWRLGAGLTVGITMRADSHYLPLPLVLPLLMVEHGRWALQTTYVPGGNGNGNVLFTWLRWSL